MTFYLSAYGGFAGISIDVYLGCSASQVGDIIQTNNHRKYNYLIIYFLYVLY